MKNPLEDLKMYLIKSKNGWPSAILFAQIALFTATICLQKTRLYAEHDSTGVKTVLSYQIIAILVSNSRRLSGLPFLRKECGYKVNSIANLICFILAFVLEKFYEKSLSSLGFTLSITIAFLILLVIIRPSTDLGLFGLLTGVIGSVTYNLFGLKFQTWIVAAICFPLWGFRCWLDKNWLGLEGVEGQSLPTAETPESTQRSNLISESEIIEAVTVAGFHFFWVYNLVRTNCRKMGGLPTSISCTSTSIMGMLACVLIFILWVGLALNKVLIEKLNEEIRKLNEKIRKLNEENRTLNEQIRKLELNEEKRKLNEENRKLNEENRKLNRKLNEEHRTLEEEKRKLDEEKRKLDEENRKLDEEIRKLKLSEEQIRKLKLNEENRELNRKLHRKLNEEHWTVKEEKRKLDEEKGKLDEEKRKLDEENRKLDEENRTLDEQNRKLKLNEEQIRKLKLNEENRKLNRKLNRELLEKKKKLDEEKKKLDKEKRKLDEELRESSGKLLMKNELRRRNKEVTT